MQVLVQGPWPTPHPLGAATALFPASQGHDDHDGATSKAMNYATDRMDRASRNRSGLEGLWRDYRDAVRRRRRRRPRRGCEACCSCCRCGSAAPTPPTRMPASGSALLPYEDGSSLGPDHALLGRTTCSLGWNRHAVHHYGAALVERPRSAKALGDYVQMAELAGWPEVAVVAMLAHQFWSQQSTQRDHRDAPAPGDEPEQASPAALACRCSGSSSGANDPEEEPDASDEEEEGATGPSDNVIDPPGTTCDDAALLATTTEPEFDCGCGCPECGRVLCAFPAFLRPFAHTAISALEDFVARSRTHHDEASTNGGPNNMPWSAHEILQRTLLRRDLDAVRAWNRSVVPKQLRVALRLVEEPTECDGEPARHNPAETGPEGGDDDDDDAIHEALRMLLIKLLYQTVPLLACAVLVADMDAPTRKIIPPRSLGDGPQKGDAPKKKTSNLKGGATHYYKSHAAFSTLIHALILGNRTVKPSRRRSVPRYHVPVWDALHGIDQRSDYGFVASDAIFGADTEGSARRVQQSSTPLSLGAQWRQLMVEAADVPHRSARNHGDPSALYPVTYYTPRRSLSSPAGDLPPLFVVGDSHALSLAWQTIQLPVGTTPAAADSNEKRSRVMKFLVVPVLVTGLKAYHCREDARYFTRTRLLTSLRRLRGGGCRTVALSAGEIDCREGLGGPRLEGYREACLEVVPDNVDRYLSSLEDLLAHEPALEQILVLPVAPHVCQASSRVEGQASRRNTMREWNTNLRRQLPRPGLFLVDYVDDILEKTMDDAADRTSYGQRPDMAADSTHLNAAFARSFERAIASSGCDLSLLL